MKDLAKQVMFEMGIEPEIFATFEYSEDYVDDPRHLTSMQKEISLVLGTHLLAAEMIQFDDKEITTIVKNVPSYMGRRRSTGSIVAFKKDEFDAFLLQYEIILRRQLADEAARFFKRADPSNSTR
jgi:hypothetical protein